MFRVGYGTSQRSGASFMSHPVTPHGGGWWVETKYKWREGDVKEVKGSFQPAAVYGTQFRSWIEQIIIKKEKQKKKKSVGETERLWRNTVKVSGVMMVYVYGMDWLASSPNSYVEVLGPRTSECLCLETKLLERGSQVKMGSFGWALTQHSGGSGSVAQLCPALCDPMDCSPPGSSVHRIFQARMLELVAISSSRGSSWHRDQTRVSRISCTGRWILYH